MTAVAESPVTKIFAAVAGFFAVRRIAEVCVGMAFSVVLSEDRAGAGATAGVGEGRSGSFSISRRPHRRDPRHDGLCRDFRPHHGHHHHLHDQVEGELTVAMVGSHR